MNTDGNLAALAEHERKVDADEKAYEAFRKSISQELCEIEDLLGNIHEAIKEYGIQTTFTELLKEEGLI